MLGLWTRAASLTMSIVPIPKLEALEVYSHEYAIHFPGIQWPDGRPAKMGHSISSI